MIMGLSKSAFSGMPVYGYDSKVAQNSSQVPNSSRLLHKNNNLLSRSLHESQPDTAQLLAADRHVARIHVDI